MEKKPPLRQLYRNAVSYFGAILSAVSILLILILLAFMFTTAPAPYIGIFVYLVFPAFLILGLIIFFLGMWMEARRRRRFGAPDGVALPVFDLNNARHRKSLAVALVAGGVLAFLVAFSGYKTYLFTDSVDFCGKICHTVMKPEFTAYLNGPHARVPCVDCHVGPGVEWYFRSKIAGVPQVFGVLFESYPRPIPVPIKNLRPARDTCEHCHWPEKFYGAQLVQIPYFDHDEKNTAEQISFLMKTGGGSVQLGENAGIHWHMILSNRIFFRSIDPEAQRIPWVRMVLGDGSETIFRDRGIQITEQELNKLPMRMVDCIDCHNRPAHNFAAPDVLVDRNLAGGNISPKLPWIKKISTLALVRKYPDPKKAHAEIRNTIESFY
ncbi:MAG TPA: NapC/NirT family cytochrome c, partial [Thermodesulfobacteriota bacterium]|nr:NapC/NirT family cytochrome c [Thermodesulfobacteriota bacterium]